MKLFSLCLALAAVSLCATAQSTQPGDASDRDARGFLAGVPTPSPGTNAVSSPGAETSPATPGTASADSPAPNGGLRGNSADDKHKLGPGDKLSFQIIEDREPIKSLMVTDSGELDVPYVGRVRAAGKTCRQLGEELKALLEQDYYYRATVMIGLDVASRTVGRVYVWGQVRNQGAIEIPTGENFTVGKAILRAGGFGDFANKKKVKLVRTGDEGQKETRELNMVSILEQGKTEQDVTLQPDDFIIVPARLINW
jgi:protein involved in polysaccharide export with SLBB domain